MHALACDRVGHRSSNNGVRWPDMRECVESNNVAVGLCRFCHAWDWRMKIVVSYPLSRFERVT